MVKIAPFTVAHQRRKNLPLDRSNAPTDAEQQRALIDGLANVLLAAKDTIEILKILAGVGDDFGPQDHQHKNKWLDNVLDTMKQRSGSATYPALPNLRRFVATSGGTPALTHILKTSTRLSHLDVATGHSSTLVSPPCDLSSLVSL